MKKKIIFAITKGNFGGAQRYVYDIATNLSKEEFEVKVICGEGEILPKTLEEKGIPTVKIEGLGREINATGDYKTFKKLLEIIKEEKPYIIHFNSSKMGFLGAFAIFYLNIYSLIKTREVKVPKSIFTSHGWAFNEKNRSALEKIVFYISHYFTVLVCSSTIAVSEKTKRDISWLPFIERKISVVHNGIDKIDFITKEVAREKIAGDKQEKIVIYSMSELHNNKGIDVAIRGIALTPYSYRQKILYCIAGEGEERTNIEKLITNLKLENNVKLLGFTPNASAYLLGADIFLMPSRTENLPYAILEAGLAGLPIISTSVGGIPEVIKDMQNGVLIHPQNTKEVEKAIIYSIDHREKIAEFGREIKNTVTNLFTLKEMVGKTEEIYKS